MTFETLWDGKKCYCRQFVVHHFLSIPWDYQTLIENTFVWQDGLELKPLLYNHDIQILISVTHIQRLLLDAVAQSINPAPVLLQQDGRWRQKNQLDAHICTIVPKIPIDSTPKTWCKVWTDSSWSCPLTFAFMLWHPTLISLCVSVLLTHACTNDKRMNNLYSLKKV